MNFVEELRWRGMIHNITPKAEEAMNTQKIAGYIGVDPTAPSLTIGNLASLMMLLHFKKHGHHPIALVGGATGMVGDPSGKKAERTLLSKAILDRNIAKNTAQIHQLLSKVSQDESEITVVNNHDWYKDMGVLDFLRDIGKHLTVNYMMAKDSVKSRMEAGISFTEFSYQLIQGYDFKWLYEHHDCKLQMGGSDQWGNMTAGTQLIRRMLGKEDAHVITCPLITKADGTKFGKSESGNVWLAPELTSPYKFYQFWLNVTDEEAKKYLRIFTFLTKKEIEALEVDHAAAPHTRILQKRLSQEVTTLVHSAEAYETAVKASQILFGKGTQETLLALSEQELLDLFEGVPTFTIPKASIEEGVGIIDFLASTTAIYKSKGEARRAIKGNAVSLNKQKVSGIEQTVTTGDLMNGKYILAQKGKKKYNLVIVE